MSDPREINEKAKAQREQALREMELERQLRELERLEQKRLEGAKKTEPPPTEITRKTSIKDDSFSDALSPEVRELAEKEAGGTIQTAFEIRETQTGKGTKQVQEIIDAQERWYQENVAGPAEAAAQERRAAAESLKLQGRDVEAGLAYSGFMATKAIKGVAEGFTFAVRPKAWQQAGRQVSDIWADTPVVTKTVITTDKFGLKTTEITERGTRSLVWEGIAADPGGFVAETAGGLLGGELFVRGVKTGYDKLTGTKTVKVTQIDEVKLRDVDLSGRGAPIETEVTPFTSSKTQRVPDIPLEGIDQADTLFGTAEGQGFKVTMKAGQIDDLFEGKTVKTGGVKGEIIGVPDEYKPVAGLEDVKTGFMGDKTVKTFTQTTGSELFKEMGEGSPFDSTIPETTLKIDQPFTVKVSGMGKLAEDIPEETFTPPQGTESPWTLGEKLREGRTFWESRGQAYKTAEVTEDSMKNLFGGGEAAKTLTQEIGETTGTTPAIRVTTGPEPTGWWTGTGGVVDVETSRPPLFDERMKQFGETKQRESQGLINIPDIQAKQEDKLFGTSRSRIDPATKQGQDPIQGPIVNRLPVNIIIDIQKHPDPTKQTIFSEQTQKQAPIQITELKQTTVLPPPPFMLKTTQKTPPLFPPSSEKRVRRSKRGDPLGFETRSYEETFGAKTKKARKFKV